MIPLGDKEHLKEIIVDVNSYSTEGSSYYSGGGGFCFSKLKSDDNPEFWGFKTVNYSNGQTQIVVPYDGYFTNTDQEQVQADVLDDNIEWQPDWWKFSEKQGDKGTDVVVNYSKVTLVYEYDNTQPIEKILGDVNTDGKVDKNDVVALSKWIVKENVKINSELADVNSDGKINVFDLSLLKGIVLG